MDRTERLLNLVTFFLDTTVAVSLDEIRDAFPDDYSGSTEASQRKFERDKAELYELGIPLRFEPQTDFSPGGYVLDRAAYYLPDPGFTSEELAVLYAAGSAALASGAFPARQDLAHALRKVGFHAEGAPSSTSTKLRLELGDAKALATRLEIIWSGITTRKTLTLDYFSPRTKQVTSRKVDPWGLALRRGVWSLVGHCHLRGGLRTFHVQRIRSVTVNASKPKQHDFEIPDDFELDAHVASWPWEHRIHEAIDVQLSLSPELSALAPQVFGAPATNEGRVTLKVTHQDALLQRVLSLGNGVRIVGPLSFIARQREMVERVLEGHRS